MRSAFQERPPRTYVTGSVIRWIRRGSLLLTGITVIAVLAQFSALPESIPTHFNVAGEADAWGPRSSVWVLLGILVTIGVGFSWLSHYPQVFNFPGEVTEENAQQLYRAGEQMLVWITCFCTVMFAGIMASIFWGFNTSIIVLPAALGLVASVIVGLIRMVRA